MKMKAGSATKWSDRIARQIDPVATAIAYAPGFHGKNAILHTYGVVPVRYYSYNTIHVR